MDDAADEHILSTTRGEVVKARSVKRLAKEDQDVALADRVSGGPWFK